jgi:hypothetical protein
MLISAYQFRLTPPASLSNRDCALDLHREVNGKVEWLVDQRNRFALEQILKG